MAVSRDPPPRVHEDHLSIATPDPNLVHHAGDRQAEAEAVIVAHVQTPVTDDKSIKCKNEWIADCNEWKRKMMTKKKKNNKTRCICVYIN